MRYNVKLDHKKILNSRKNLQWLYDQMPETTGCMENIAKGKDGCGSICCETQFPSVWYVEFLNSWNYIIHNWTDQQIISIIEKSLRNYLYPKPERSCVFWNKETKMCNQHEHRCYACRIYGIEPEEEFNERFVRLKVIYPHIRQQCNLVKTSDNSVVSKENTKYWWSHLKNFESVIGVPYNLMNDNDGGSYRSYHDHILMHLFDDATMELLSNTRLDGDPIQKETCIRRMLSGLSDYIDRETKK